MRFDAFERRFGNDDAVVVAVHSPSGIFDLDSATLLRELTERMWQVPEVIRVDSLSNYNWVHANGDDIVVEPLLPAVLTPELLAERKAGGAGPRDDPRLPGRATAHVTADPGRGSSRASTRRPTPSSSPTRCASWWQE